MNACQQLKPAKKRACLILVALSLFISTPLFPAAMAEQPLSGSLTTADDDRIQIEADKLMTHHAEKFAEFSGNVRASQGAFVINADRLRIYYQAASVSAAQQATGQESIHQVIASGNVKLSTGKFTAETDRAEYDLETQVLVLIGERSALKSKRNKLTGSKIIVNRKTGQMRVEGDPQKRVKAVFYPNENSQEKE